MIKKKKRYIFSFLHYRTKIDCVFSLKLSYVYMIKHLPYFRFNSNLYKKNTTRDIAKKKTHRTTLLSLRVVVHIYIYTILTRFIRHSLFFSLGPV